MNKQAGPHPDPFAQVYPRAVRGRFRRLKSAAGGILLAIGALVPWLRWDRGPGAPNQAVLIDIPSGRLHMFGLEIWPQDLYYLSGVLILAALGLFLATTLFGRLWCGYGCPQTVWTDLFLWIERKTEGDRSARIKLDRAPWGAAKLARKTAKHAAWIAVSLITGASFGLYFVDAPTTILPVLTGGASLELYGFILGMAAATYVMAGFMREQFCTYMCPWPRIQGTMLDRHSLIVSYDAQRGEPRRSAKPGQDFGDRGHCVNCTLCVQVCPTGIDIRNGMQMACIGCGLCIDACNGVMARFGLPANLIGWTSLAAAEEPRSSRAKQPWLRPRILVYGGLMVATGVAMIVAFAGRQTMELDVLHDRAPLFTTLADGSVRNGFTLRVLNKDRAPRRLDLETADLTGAEVSVIGEDGTDLALAPSEVATYRVLVRAPAGTAAAQTRFHFVLRDPKAGEAIRHASIFFTGGRD